MSMQRICPRAKVDKTSRTDEAALFRALADPYRLRIIATLARTKHAVCVCDFADAFPLGQPTVSHHLAVLREAGILNGERCGTWVMYRLADDFAARVNGALADIIPGRIAA